LLGYSSKNYFRQQFQGVMNLEFSPMQGVAQGGLQFGARWNVMFDKLLAEK
jgi:hypothetical protein